ncbi:MAG: MlaD family protein [Nitrospirota bacterium]|mgnify:CR=1 FL=1
MRDEIKAGIIIIASLLILSAAIILIGGSQFYQKFDTYFVMVINAAGLETGSQVRLGGVKIGRVVKINAPDGPGKPISIEIGIKRGTTLYKGTKAFITQIGFVGDIYMLLAIDKTSNETIKPGSVIPSEEQVQFNEIMAKTVKLSGSVDGLIKDINKIFSERNIKEIEKLFENSNKAIVTGSANIEKIANTLKGTTDKIEHVLNEISGIVTDNKGEVALILKKAREDIEKAGDMIKAIEETVRTVDKTTKAVDGAINLQSQNLDNLFTTLNNTTKDLQDLLQEKKNKPWSFIYKEGKEKEE